MPEKRKVRRCLLGRPDPDVLEKELEKLLDTTMRDGRQKWHFDFAEGKPLNNNGRYQWTEVKDDCYVPEFYRKGYSTKTKRFRELRSSEFDAQPIVPRSANQLDTLPQGNNTNNCTPCVTRSTDVRTDVESLHNDVDEAVSETRVCSSSSSNTTTCSASLVQSTVTDFMKPVKRRWTSPVELHIGRKSPRI